VTAKSTKTRRRRPRLLRPAVPAPTTPAAWFREVAAAYADAREAIPFGPLVDVDLTEHELFHLAPAVCLKFRGLQGSKTALKRATEAALSSYVAMTGRDAESLARLSSPQMAFAFCYIAAHYGLDLVSEEEASETLDYIARHKKQLAKKEGRRLPADARRRTPRRLRTKSKPAV
jgi:hypothetical protein